MAGWCGHSELDMAAILWWTTPWWGTCCKQLKSPQNFSKRWTILFGWVLTESVPVHQVLGYVGVAYYPMVGYHTTTMVLSLHRQECSAGEPQIPELHLCYLHKCPMIGYDTTIIVLPVCRPQCAAGEKRQNTLAPPANFWNLVLLREPCSKFAYLRENSRKVFELCWLFAYGKGLESPLFILRPGFEDCYYWGVMSSIPFGC